VVFTSPTPARSFSTISRPDKQRHHRDAAGVAFIHQELNVLDNLDVAANVFLGRTQDRPRSSSLIEEDLRRYRALLEASGPEHFQPHAGGQTFYRAQQMVEIAKRFRSNARIIIMDEPTSSLTLSETALLQLVRELASRGVSVIYISHRLGESRLRRPRHCLRDSKNAGQLAGRKFPRPHRGPMVGREIKSFYVEIVAAKTPGYFKVRNLRSSRYPDKAGFI